ncbi:uncharacterized protein LOC116848466 [Odontomachus brunneus]|uniref:uncharacterized protein LOC116848466 n=1 Tax=Odontomachus brunneus TaxID=486640 RepID=UPI0013F1E25C|nr:uncharacterized protein LOC116848466 [Odontomachus brunneus]
MICIEAEHFSVHRILLLIVGLWPYQRSKLVLLQTIITFVILLSFVIFQVCLYSNCTYYCVIEMAAQSSVVNVYFDCKNTNGVFLTAEYTSDLLTNVLPTALAYSGVSVNFLSFWINIRTVKCLLERLQDICNKLKDENEIAIIKTYSYQARKITIILTRKITLFVLTYLHFLFAFPAIVLIAQPIWPRVLGIFFYLNESLFRRKTLILTEYFVDQEKYSYLIMLHTNIAVFIGTFAMIATGMLLLVSLKHACGMFSIASYRIERAITNNKRENVNLKDQNVIFRRMVYAIDIHRKAMQYSNFLISSFEGTFFLLIAFGVVCLSLNLFRIFQLTSTGGDKFELLSCFVYTICILSYMFIANAIGQEITDHNDQVYFTAYKVKWYATPLHVQKLILFLIQRGNKTFGLNVGGLFVASLECFATLISASLSYFTVIYSTQQ